MSTIRVARPPLKARGPHVAVKLAVAAVIGLSLIGLALLLLVGRLAGLAVRPGFLGTRAGLFADLNLLAEILLLVGLTFGYGLARAKWISAHQYNQTGWVFFNVVLVMFIMIVSFARQVVPGIPLRLLRAYYATAFVHSALGGLTILLAVVILLRMNKLLPKALRFKGWKNLMRLTLGMYWLVGLFGLVTYYVWYIQPREASGAPEATTAQAGTVVVPLANYSFNPGGLDVPVGTTVVFRNDDPDPHTVTSDSGAFNEGVLEEKAEYSVTFDQEGEFPYFCQYHGGKGGVGMAGVIRVGGTAVAALPTVVAPPPPTAQPTPPPPETAPLGAQAVGVAVFRDGGGRSNLFTVVLAGLPTAPNGELHAWLTGDGAARDMGQVRPSPDGAGAVAYFEPNGGNLLAQYTGFKLTVEAAGSAPAAPSSQVLIENAIPAGVVAPVRQLLVSSSDAPGSAAYAVGLVRMSEELFRHAKAVNGAALLGDFDGMNRHIEHVLTIVEGKGGEHYKDFDGNGQLQDPGDGFGLLHYAEAIRAQAEAALAAPDGTENSRLHAGHLLVMAQNITEWSHQIVDLALKAHTATALADQQAYAGQALQAAKAMLNGVDANGNGSIEPIPGEGGAYTIYFHAQYLAALGALPEPGSGIAAPTPTLEAEASATPAAPEVTEAATEPAQATVAPQATAVPPTAVPPTTAPPTAAPTAVPATAAPVFITYRNFEIVPAQTTIKAGTPVTFLIQGSPHQPYNFTPPNTFEAPANLGDGTSFTFTFKEAGTVTILCGYHGSMSATVVVQP